MGSIGPLGKFPYISYTHVLASWFEERGTEEQNIWLYLPPLRSPGLVCFFYYQFSYLLSFNNLESRKSENEVVSYLLTLPVGTVFDSVQHYGGGGLTRLGIIAPLVEISRIRESL